jgi:hypothetical protein
MNSSSLKLLNQPQSVMLSMYCKLPKPGPRALAALSISLSDLPHPLPTTAGFINSLLLQPFILFVMEGKDAYRLVVLHVVLPSSFSPPSPISSTNFLLLRIFKFLLRSPKLYVIMSSIDQENGTSDPSGGSQNQRHQLNASKTSAGNQSSLSKLGMAY